LVVSQKSLIGFIHFRPHIEDALCGSDWLTKSLPVMDRLHATKLFVRVVENGNVSSAAREMKIGQPAASKQIASRENHLGAQLLMRTSRRLTLTEAGRELYRRSFGNTRK